MKSFRTVIGITVLAATESFATHEFEDFDHTVEGPDGNKIEVKGIKADEHTQNFNKLGDSFDVVAKNTLPEDTFKCDNEDDLPETIRKNKQECKGSWVKSEYQGKCLLKKNDVYVDEKKYGTYKDCHDLKDLVKTVKERKENTTDKQKAEVTEVEGITYTEGEKYWHWDQSIYDQHKDGIYNSNFDYWQSFRWSQYTGFGGGSMLRFTSSIHTLEPLKVGRTYQSWVQMYSNGSIINEKNTNDSVFNALNVCTNDQYKADIKSSTHDCSLFETMQCTVRYHKSGNGYNKFSPWYSHYHLAQGCGPSPMQRIIFDQDKNWRKEGQVEGPIGKDDFACNPFWTNLDNTNFDSPKYKWGDDIDDMVSTVKCSAARDFNSNGIEAIGSNVTKINLKLDAPIKFRIGYQVWSDDKDTNMTPRAFGWGIPVVVLIQKTGALSLAITTTTLMAAANYLF